MKLHMQHNQNDAGTGYDSSPRICMIPHLSWSY